MTGGFDVSSINKDLDVIEQEESQGKVNLTALEENMNSDYIITKYSYPRMIQTSGVNRPLITKGSKYQGKSLLASKKLEIYKPTSGQEIVQQKREVINKRNQS